jgi:hypothetical protein
MAAVAALHHVAISALAASAEIGEQAHPGTARFG